MESDAKFISQMSWCFADGVAQEDRDRYEALARRGAAVQDLPSKIREAAEISPYADGMSPSFGRGLYDGYEAAAQIVESALPPPPAGEAAMSDELRERLVARIKETRPDACVASSLEGWSHDAFDRYIADAAIALIWNEAMEEAAKVAETPVEVACCNNPNWSGKPKDQPECCGNPEYRWGNPGEIAAAILARKKP